MWHVLLLLSSITTAVVGAPVTGYRGKKVDIKCSYDSGYETNLKYFCKGECKPGSKVIMVESGSPAIDERFSLTDDTTNRVFTVTITDLTAADGGQYWCTVRRRSPLTDVYSEIMLLVKFDNETTEASTVSTFQAPSLSLSPKDHHFSTTGQVNQQSTNTNNTDAHFTHTTDAHVSANKHVLHISMGLIIMVIVFLLALMLFLRHRKSKKSQRVTQSGISQHESVGERSSTREDLNEEDCDDNKYQEISELQNLSDNTSAIYSIAENPEDSTIYSTADKPEEPLIFSTADEPEDTKINSTADQPEDTMIYSTADKPEEPIIYSTADKPEEPMIYSTADKTEDPMIYSTADGPDEPVIYSTEDEPMIYSTADKPEDSTSI